MSATWRSWAEPMGSTTNCWWPSHVPWEEHGWQPNSVGGWANLTYNTANVIVDGDHSWMWYVWAHEMGHLWDHNVLQPYNMKPAISQVMGWTEWPVEGWADLFATCLGWMSPTLSIYWEESRAATPDQCYTLDNAGLLPPTAPRGFQPI
jgi:hypothetical protein